MAERIPLVIENGQIEQLKAADQLVQQAGVPYGPLATAAPANVTKAAAAVGVATTSARADHKHDVTTAAAVAVGATNAEGAATSLARSNHTHEVTDLKIASQVQGDIIYFNGTNWVRLAPGTSSQVLRTNGAAANPSWATVSGGLVMKAGRVVKATFAGSPKKATVTFGAAFADALYAVTLTSNITVSGSNFAPVVESQVAGSFVINMGANNITDLIQVG